MSEENKRWFIYGYLAALAVDLLLVALLKGWAWLGESEAIVYTIPPAHHSNNGSATDVQWEIIRSSVEGIAHT